MPCCTGINGSHTGLCPQNTGETIRCWDCGAEVPRHYAMAWSVLGSRCLQHEGTRLEELKAATEALDERLQ